MSDMTIRVELHKETRHSTLSKLYVNNKFECYILEDGFNEPKIWGETRIPSGRYEIIRRYEGKFAELYRKKFNHVSALWLQDVPNFTFILIHIGNTVLDTHGCLLTGTRYTKKHDEYTVQESTRAYRKLYTKISRNFKSGHRVFIEISRDKE